MNKWSLLACQHLVVSFIALEVNCTLKQPLTQPQRKIIVGHQGSGENRQLVTDEPVEFEKWPVEVEDCMKIIDYFRGIYRIYPSLTKENRRMSTCNRLDLQTHTRISTDYAQKFPRSLLPTAPRTIDLLLKLDDERVSLSLEILDHATSAPIMQLRMKHIWCWNVPYTTTLEICFHHYL